MCAMEGSVGSGLPSLTTPRSSTHPYNIDSDQHIDRVIAGDPLEHTEVGVVSCLLGDIIGERHFVDTNGALVREIAQHHNSSAAQGKQTHPKPPFLRSQSISWFLGTCWNRQARSGKFLHHTSTLSGSVTTGRRKGGLRRNQANRVLMDRDLQEQN